MCDHPDTRPILPEELPLIASTQRFRQRQAEKRAKEQKQAEDDE